MFLSGLHNCLEFFQPLSCYIRVSGYGNANIIQIPETA